MRLKDKAAIVTGSARGIGKAIALTLAREGADVVVNYNTSAAKAEETAQEICALGRRSFAFRADVSRRSEVDAMVYRAMSDFGKIDILVNNAGIPRRVDLMDASEEDWDIVIDTNLKGAFNCIQAAGKHMVQAKSGKIVNIGSTTGLGSTVMRNISYVVSKAGMFALTKKAAFELGKYGINVNCVAPGKVMTDISYLGRSKEEVEADIQQRTKFSALGRLGIPQDVANAVLFMASLESDFITGQVLVVDGGRTDYLSHSL